MSFKVNYRIVNDDSIENQDSCRRGNALVEELLGHRFDAEEEDEQVEHA